MAASTLIALSEWKYYVLSFLPWLQTVCLAVFIVAALLHWQRTRHWCLLALATGTLLMALGTIAGQLAWMYPDGKLASGAVKGNASLVTISMWLSTSSMVVAAAGGIGAIHWAIKLRRPLEARIVDPTFGELRRIANSEWTGEVVFTPTQQCVVVSIDAAAAGPTDGQRSLFRRIEQKYDELLPAISRSLADYVKQDWHFELCDIEIPADPQSDKWTCQFEKTGEEDFMGYFVDIVEWKVAGVTGID